uniref:Pyrin domain-containing protein n=1 Tax=Labrus bergylta TaxID=56723 RepID=A0A3Q3FSC7_9LABR
MPRKTIKMALSDTLENLSQQNFAKFCHRLLDRRNEPRVRRNRVEGKSYLDVVDVLVSTFTESGGRNVAVEILRQIGCSEEAEELGEVNDYPISRLGLHRDLSWLNLLFQPHPLQTEPLPSRLLKSGWMVDFLFMNP